ncbi:MAG: hypothetical protein ACJ74Y_05175 [Bryobacteraceae bacterium]
MTVLLRRQGWQVNTKRVYRVYGDEGSWFGRNKRKNIAPPRPLWFG